MNTVVFSKGSGYDPHEGSNETLWELMGVNGVTAIGRAGRPLVNAAPNRTETECVFVYTHTRTRPRTKAYLSARAVAGNH